MYTESMHERFRQHLEQINEVAKEQLAAEELGSETSELDQELGYMLKRQARRRSSDFESQDEIYRIQRVKQERMQELRARMASLDSPEYVSESDGKGVGLHFEEGKLLVETPDGPQEVTEGEVLSNLSWGMRYSLDRETVPRRMHKRYILEETKVALREDLNQQILTDELSSDRVDGFKKDAYQAITDRDNAEFERKQGLIAEKVITSFFNRLQFDTNLDFKFEAADAYQDVNQKIDFIIRRSHRQRGVDVEESDIASGIQFTTNQSAEALEHKANQVARANEKLTDSDDVHDIVLVKLSARATAEICDAYREFKKQDVHSVDTFLSPEVKAELFHNILTGVFHPDDVAEQWQALQEKTVHDVAPEAEEPPSEKPTFPQTFEQGVAYLRETNLEEVERQARELGLYYHNAEHTKSVERRAAAIVRAICSADGIKDTSHLLALSSTAAVIHDVRQVFEEETPHGNPRSRKPGVSEASSLKLFLDQRDELARQHGTQLISDDDVEVLAEALDCTVAAFTPEKGIYQPNLSAETSVVARAIALADLGGLGMDGVYQFQEESVRVFLEENPDLVDQIWSSEEGRIDLSKLDERERDVFTRRIKRRSWFNILFAKTRLQAFESELSGLSAEATQAVRELFSGFEEAVEDALALEQGREDMDLEELIESFQFEMYIPEYR